MDLRVLLLADVAVRPIFGNAGVMMHIRPVEPCGREHIRGMDHGFLPLRTNPGSSASGLMLPDALCPALPGGGLRHEPPLRTIRAVDTRYRLQQAISVLRGQFFEHCAIGRNRLQELDRLMKAPYVCC